MKLNELKLKRLEEATGKSSKKKGGGKKMRRLASGAQAYVDEDEESDDTVVEAEKAEPRTPQFVKHCVAAIVEKPKASQPKEPFGVCYAQYKKDKRSLAAKHSKGKHHTVKDYERALKKLRESIEERADANIDPRHIVYGPSPIMEERVDVRSIRFSG